LRVFEIALRSFERRRGRGRGCAKKNQKVSQNRSKFLKKNFWPFEFFEFFLRKLGVNWEKSWEKSWELLGGAGKC